MTKIEKKIKNKTLFFPAFRVQKRRMRAMSVNMQFVKTWGTERHNTKNTRREQMKTFLI